MKKIIAIVTITASIYSNINAEIINKEGVKGWKIIESTDYITDEKKVLFFQNSLEKNKYNEDIKLTITCSKKTGTMTHISWGTLLHKSPNLEYRFDKEQSVNNENLWKHTKSSSYYFNNEVSQSVKNSGVVFVEEIKKTFYFNCSSYYLHTSDIKCFRSW